MKSQWRPPDSRGSGRPPVLLAIVALAASGVWACAAIPNGEDTVSPTGSIDGLEAKFVDVGGVRTRYYDNGRGEPIVLVHGGGMGGASTANNWSRNIRGLAERFRVIAVDRLAQGMTGNPKDDADFTNQGAVSHVYQFIQMMRLGPVHLVGHSSGGALAFYLAVEHPEIVKTLVVVAHGPGMPPAGEGPTKFAAILEKCPPDPTSYEHRQCRLLALAHTPDTFPPDYAAADEYMGNLPKSVETRKRMDALRAAQPHWPDERNNAYRQQMWDRARSEGVREMPILIYAAKQDTLGWDADDPHSMMRGELGFFDLVGARNPRVKMVVVNEAGHFPYREHPEQFNADLTHFIDFWNPPMQVTDFSTR